MNRKISLGMAVTIVILAMTVTFSITMLIAMRLFDSTVNSVKEKESMYNKIAEVDRYVRSNDYYTIDEATLYDRLTAGYLLGTGDKYARYYTANAYTELMNIQSGKILGIGVAASQMEKKGIATERGELNRSIKAANRLLCDIKAQIGKLKEWLLDVFKAKESLRAEPPQPKSPDLSTLLFRYLDIQKANGRKYSQSWQQQHTVDELKAISKAVNLLSEKGIYTLEELDAALSAVHDKASEIRSAMKPREARIKRLQKLIEQAQNFQKTQPIHDECKQIRWKGKQEKFAEAHRADLAVWDAANRYLRANLPDMKLTPKAWQTELAALTTENEAEYAKLKAQREEVAELQKVRRYVDTALKADAPQKTKTKHHDIDR